MDELTDEEFTNEMKILWQCSDNTVRQTLGSIIRVYYDYGSRADRIIEKLQVTLDKSSWEPNSNNEKIHKEDE